MGAKGYEMARRGQGAEVYVVNTCTVTATADAKARKLIRRIAREHPEAVLIVTGCLAERAPEAAALPGVTAVVPGTEKGTLPEVVAELRPFRHARRGPVRGRRGSPPGIPAQPHPCVP